MTPAVPDNPPAVPVNPNGIPPELQELPRWILWRYEIREGKTTKVPYTVTGKQASSTRAGDWDTFSKAMEVYEYGDYSGIGFVFAQEDGLTGIDFDSCLVDGKLVPEVRAIVERFGTYAEISPSGTGIKLWIRGTVPRGRRTSKVPWSGPKAGIEIYSSGRYFCVTGESLNGFDTIIDGQELLDRFYRKYFGEPEQSPPKVKDRPPRPIPEGLARWAVEQLQDETQDRSGRDFAVLVKLIEAGCGREAVQRLVGPYSKFSDPRADYFDRTWTNASKAAISNKPEAPDILPWAPFPVDALPYPVRRFVQAAAKSTGTDPAFAAMASLVVLAGCIGNRAAALVKGGWVEPAVLWGVLVGRSGTTKSPVLKAVTRPLFQLYKGERQDYLSRLAEYAREQERYAVRLTVWKAEQRKGDLSDPPEEPDPPKEKRVVVSDITVEKLGCLLNDNPLGLLLVRDELAAWIGSFDRYAAGGKGSDCPAWLSMYDASPVTIDRKSAAGTIFCERAAVSVLGSIQPGVLARVFGTPEREAGLLGRVLLAYPPDKPSLWTDVSLPDDVASDWRELLSTLLAIEPGVDDNGDPRPRYMPISDEAKPVFIEWHDRHARETVDIDNEDLAAHFAKLKGACVRIALLMECVTVATTRSGRASISEDAMRRAIPIVEWFKNEGQRVYAILAEVEEENVQRRLVEWIERHGGGCTVRELAHGPRQYRGKTDTAREALDGLEKAGVGRWVYSTPSPSGGRPSPRFELVTGGTGTKTADCAITNKGFGTSAGGDSDADTPPAATRSRVAPVPKPPTAIGNGGFGTGASGDSGADTPPEGEAGGDDWGEI